MKNCKIQLTSVGLAQITNQKLDTEGSTVQSIQN